MKIKCNRAALYEAVQLASSIVPTRTPKPILQCAKIEADQERQTVAVMATDNEISIQYIITQVEVGESGTAVVPADRVAAILHESRDESISIDVNDSLCEVKGKDSHFKIYGHDPDDYPTFEGVEDGFDMQIEAGVLKRMLHMSSFAAAKENTRYAINGVLWEQKAKKLRMVGTDGRRLAKIDGSAVAAESDADKSAIVPGKTMQIIERILNDAEEKIQIGLMPNQICVRTTAVQITSNLVQGRFPKYEDVIPEGCDKKITINTDLLRSGVKRVALLSNEQSRGVLLSFSNNSLCLTSSTPEAGEAEIRVDVSYEGDEFSIGFNPQYILEVLRVIEEDELQCELTDGNKPGMIRSGKDFLYVLMPVTV